MLGMLKRHEVEILLKAGHPQTEVARLAGVSLCSVKREGLPGEFSQHDFGQVDVAFLDGSIRRVHFFASRLKYSRYIRVSVVKNEAVESLVRNLAEHVHSWGGVPLRCVFDRPKTVALKWRRNGEVTEWNPVFAYAMLEIGIGVELCWPQQPQQKGTVENLVGFVKSSFFKVRRFHDEEPFGFRPEVVEFTPDHNFGEGQEAENRASDDAESPGSELGQIVTDDVLD